MHIGGCGWGDMLTDHHAMLPFRSRYNAADYATMWRDIKNDVRFKAKGGARGAAKWNKNTKKLVKETYFQLVGHTGNRKMDVEAQAGILKETRQPVKLKSWQQTEKLKRELGQSELPTKYAYVPTTLSPKTGKPYRVNVIHRADKPDMIWIQGVSHQSVEFNQDRLFIDPEREIERAIHALEDSGAFRGNYSIDIDVGRHKIGYAEYDKNTVGSEIIRLQNKYGSNSLKVQRDPGRHYENWLRGVTVRRATKQKSLEELSQSLELHRAARARGAKSHFKRQKAKALAQKRAVIKLKKAAKKAAQDAKKKR